MAISSPTTRKKAKAKGWQFVTDFFTAALKPEGERWEDMVFGTVVMVEPGRDGLTVRVETKLNDSLDPIGGLRMLGRRVETLVNLLVEELEGPKL